MTVGAIIVAAGAGERLGAGTAKAFVDLNGEPMVVWSARAFDQAESVRHLVIVVPPDAAARARQLLAGAGVDATVCEGGDTRQGSVSLGLAACPAEDTVVAVHDAARPLVTPHGIDRIVGALTEPWDAVAPGLPVVDTLKLVEPTRHAVLRTVDRTGLWAVQTPQVFRRSALERVHARVATSADAATDDLALVERAGGRVRLVEGERRNLKVTYPEDLRLAATVLRDGAW